VSVAVTFAVTALPIVPAQPMKTLTVHLNASGSRVLEAINSAAVLAGMDCRPRDDGVHGLHCQLSPGPTVDFRGKLEVVDVTEKKSVVISVFSRTASPVPVQLDSVIERALENFIKAVSAIPEVQTIEQCVGPDWTCSPLKFRD
jgi:hypothetical protein